MFWDVAGAGRRVGADGDTERRVGPVLDVAAQARGLEERLPVVRDVLRLPREPEQRLLQRGVVDDDVAHELRVADGRRPTGRLEHAGPHRDWDRPALEGPEGASGEDSLACVGLGREADVRR